MKSVEILLMNVGNIHREDILDFVAWMHLGQVNHRANQQAGSSQQGQTERRLENRNAPEHTTLWFSRAAGTRGFECLGRVESQRA